MKITGSIFQSFLSVVFIIISTNLNARELAGVSIEEQVSVSGIEQPLILNGAGIRYKIFFKIYVGALYLPQPQKNAAVILNGSQANRVVMHFVYDEVPQKKLVSAWQDGFESNTDESAYRKLKTRLAKFNQMFTSLHEGDVVLLDYLPGTGTRVSIKGEEKGVIEGADFNRALLSVWLGEDPVTEDLKEAMLGIDD